MAFTFKRQPLASLLLFLLGWLILPVTEAAGITALTLNDPVTAQQLERHLQYACTNPDTGLEGALGLDYQPVTRSRISLGYVSQACWFRFKLANAGDTPLRLVIAIHFPMLDHATLHIPEPTGLRILTAGDAEPFSIRPLQVRFFSYPVDLPAHASQDYYLRVATTSSFNLPITVSGRDAFAEEHINNELALGVFYGIGIGLFFYNFFLWAVIRERSYLAYIVHLGSSLLFYASLQGIAYRWWPDWPEWNNRSTYVFAYVSMISGTLFAREFLMTAKWPRMDRLFLAMTFLGLFAAIGQFVLPARLINPLLGILALANMLLLTGTGIIRWRAGQHEARIFVLAWGLFLISLVAVALNTYGILPTLIISLYGMQIGLIVQQILLSLALAYRINILKREKQQQEQESRLARSENEAKGNFLATMSHEIRTPMNAVIGITQLLRDTPLNDQQRSYVDMLNNAGQSLLGLISDILDYSKMNAGRLQLEAATFNLHDLLRDCRGMFDAAARQKALALTVEQAEELPVWARGDPTRLRQVLVNLLSNAVKFTDKGHITLRAGLLPCEEGGRLLLAVQVEDTGIGLTTDECDQLFKVFSQADSGTARKYGGSGLGLAISKQIIELMGGSIGVRSLPGQGSTFWFTAPLDSATAPDDLSPHEPGDHLAMHHMCVLVVEDNAVNRLVITSMLHKLGVRTRLAHQGEEALAMIKQHSDIDLILMDCEMPVMDGYTATRQIRSLEQEQGLRHTPIIALTAHALQEHRERCLACGMNDHIAKPISLEELTRLLLRWQPVSAASRHAPSGSTS
ncbi:MAG: 7TM diverse intracellular signaling domain-containing protein [Gammaproteobacteria bacterium]